MTDQAHIEAIVSRLGELFGLSYTAAQQEILLRNLAQVAAGLNRPADLISLKQWLGSDQFEAGEIDALSRHLTIGETYFFREQVALDLFSQVVVPQLLNVNADGTGTIAIWSAGCSTGEEPYSLAILLREMLSDQQLKRVSIVATDVNREALDKARQAIYTSWSFRETSPGVKQKYFKPVDRRFQLIPEITKMVQFRPLNLASDDLGKFAEERQFDIIFCRNVLMYFLPEKIRAIAHQFHRCLRDDGWLVTSQVELNDDYFAPFNRILWNKGIFYQKGGLSVPLLSMSIDRLDEVRGQVSTATDSPKRRKILERRATKRSGQATPTLLPRHTALPEDDISELQRLFGEGLYDECARRCEAIIHRGGFGVVVGKLLVKALSNGGRLTEAADWATKLVEAGRDEADSHYLQATVLLELHDDEAAATALQKVLYLAPSHLAAKLNLGQLLLRSGKRAPAIRHFKNLLHDLDRINDDEPVAEMGGITAGRLRQMTEMLMNR